MIQNKKYKRNSKKLNIKYKNKTIKHVRFIGGINEENISSDAKATGKLVAKTKKDNLTKNIKEIPVLTNLPKPTIAILSELDKKIENLQYLLFQNIINNIPDITINNIIGSKIPFKYENDSDNPVILYFLYAYNLYKTDSEKIPHIKKEQYILKQKINEILNEINNKNQYILPKLYKEAKIQSIKVILLKQLYFNIISYKKYIISRIKSKDFQFNDIIKDTDNYTENIDIIPNPKDNKTEISNYPSNINLPLNNAIEKQSQLLTVNNTNYKNVLKPIYIKLYMDIINIIKTNINEEIIQYIKNQIKLEKINNDDKKNIIDNMQNLIEVIDEIIKEEEQNILDTDSVVTEASSQWPIFSELGYLNR